MSFSGKCPKMEGESLLASPTQHSSDSHFCMFHVLEANTLKLFLFSTAGLHSILRDHSEGRKKRKFSKIFGLAASHSSSALQWKHLIYVSWPPVKNIVYLMEAEQATVCAPEQFIGTSPAVDPSIWPCGLLSNSSVSVRNIFRIVSKTEEKRRCKNILEPWGQRLNIKWSACHLAIPNPVIIFLYLPSDVLDPVFTELLKVPCLQAWMS